jgi:signal transduction histidine kinase
LPEQFVLSADLDPELWWTLMDPGQAEQILVNLALNARDAMPNGGTIAASTSNVVVDEEPSLGAPLSPGRYVRLVVSDQGVGMTPEVRERAFDPFFTTKPEGEGTGLGLATVYAVAAQAGGSAWLTSESGRGTTVTITLPAIAAAQQ